MQYCLLAQVTQTGVSVYNLNLLAYDDVTEYGKEGKNGWECRFAVDDEKGYVVNLEAVCQVPYAGSALVSVRDDDHLVSAVDEFRGELVDMRFNSAYAMLRDDFSPIPQGSIPGWGKKKSLTILENETCQSHPRIGKGHAYAILYRITAVSSSKELWSS
jgi:hypothetical protein